jgi:hypothetical protein
MCRMTFVRHHVIVFVPRVDGLWTGPTSQQFFQFANTPTKAYAKNIVS